MKEKIFAILTNLIKNAIKYSINGHIKFGYAIKSSSSDSDQHDELEFYVKDTGIGIAKDRQEAVFNRFVQADLNITKPYEGAGLGLSISKAYVELLGGKIWMESVKSKGSQFYFTIPFKNKSAKHNDTKTPVSPTPEKRKYKDLNILIVDDDETSVIYLTALLEDEFENISYVSNGLEAVNYCRENKNVDLVMMDVKMPVMNGYEATRKIREFNKDVVIIAQTAFALMGDKEKTIEAGCNGYVAKPVDQDILFNEIEKLVD